MANIPERLAQYLEFLRGELAGRSPTREIIILTLIDYCHQNIQFYLALRNNKEAFARGLIAGLPGLLNPADVDHVVERSSISVVSEEHKFASGKYPGGVFFRSMEEMRPAIRAIMSYCRADTKSRLEDARFFCIGSCFATNVAYELSALGASVSTTVLSENVNSPRNNRDLFRYFDGGAKSGLLCDESLLQEESLERIRSEFLGANTLVMTLGCAYSLVSAAGVPIRKTGGRLEVRQPKRGRNRRSSTRYYWRLSKSPVRKDVSDGFAGAAGRDPHSCRRPFHYRRGVESDAESVGRRAC